MYIYIYILATLIYNIMPLYNNNEHCINNVVMNIFKQNINVDNMLTSVYMF